MQSWRHRNLEGCSNKLKRSKERRGEVFLGESFGLKADGNAVKDRQLLTFDCMKYLRSIKPRDAFCVVGFLKADIFPQAEYAYVHGHADPKHGLALFSSARLGFQTKVGTPTWLRRCCSVLCHEVCHLLGLGHCPKQGCVMHQASTCDDSDKRPLRLCPNHLEKMLLASSSGQEESPKTAMAKPKPHDALGVLRRERRLVAFFRLVGLEEDADWHDQNIRATTAAAAAAGIRQATTSLHQQGAGASPLRQVEDARTKARAAQTSQAAGAAPTVVGITAEEPMEDSSDADDAGAAGGAGGWMSLFLERRKFRKSPGQDALPASSEDGKSDEEVAAAASPTASSPTGRSKDLLGLTVNTQALGRMIQKTKTHLVGPRLRPPPPGAGSCTSPKASATKTIRPSALNFEAAGARKGVTATH